MPAPTNPSLSNRANLFGLDYVAEAQRLGRLPFEIIDVHSHLSGDRAAAVYARAADAYGIDRVYSMTPLEELEAVSLVLGDRVRFIAAPNHHARDRQYALGEGYAEQLPQFHARGARVAKFWSAPRGVDFAEQAGAAPTAFRLDAPHVQRNMEIAADLRMSFMVHVGDPDTWFATHYADRRRYGTKAEQYEPLRFCLRRYSVPVIAAHMGGWPENLGFLDQLLAQHDNLYLDTSATKWMVRELSRHKPVDVTTFFSQWKHRLMFGSDIVTRNAHLSNEPGEAEEQKSKTESEAFDLYASRYWALRVMFETDYDGRSPIADPDLHLVDPQRFTESDSPQLKGFKFPQRLLKSFYSDTPQRMLGEVN